MHDIFYLKAMNQCPSCGGVIGRDCFNPVECAWISNQNDGRTIQELEHQIEILKKTLTDNNSEIPDLNFHATTDVSDMDFFNDLF